MENPPPLHIARSGKKLGVFSVEQVKDGLKSGLFRPADHYWCAASNSWETLDKLHPGLGVKTPPPIPAVSMQAAKSSGIGGYLLKTLGALAVIAGLLIVALAFYEPSNRAAAKRPKAEFHFRQAVSICGLLEGESGSMLAVLLCHGAIPSTDPQINALRMAMGELKKAAENGHRDAQFFAGSVLKLDPRSRDEAEAFLLRAAKQGHPLASKVLSTDYLLRPEIFGRKVEDGITWHLITPQSLREPVLTEWVSNGDGPAFVAARRRAAEFRPISEWDRDTLARGDKRSPQK